MDSEKQKQKQKKEEQKIKEQQKQNDELKRMKLGKRKMEIDTLSEQIDNVKKIISEKRSVVDEIVGEAEQMLERGVNSGNMITIKAAKELLHSAKLQSNEAKAKEEEIKKLVKDKTEKSKKITSYFQKK